MLVGQRTHSTRRDSTLAQREATSLVQLGRFEKKLSDFGLAKASTRHDCIWTLPSGATVPVGKTRCTVADAFWHDDECAIPVRRGHRAPDERRTQCQADGVDWLALPFVSAVVACVRFAASRHRRDRPIWLKRSVASPLLGCADRSVPPTMEGDMSMMVIGIDAHKRSHTAVTVDELGRRGSTKTVGTTTQDHLRLLR